MKSKILFFIAIITATNLATERQSSEPFISGDTFRKFCNFIFDETTETFDPLQVKQGDTIFLSTEPLENLKKFFEEFHPKIKTQYILVTHNGDRSIPGNGFVKYLDDEKIFMWFSQNVDLAYHKKLIPIPIGLENRHWQRNYPEIINQLISNKINLEEKKFLLYGNFTIYTNEKIRNPIAIFFKQKSFCFFESTRKNLYDFLVDVCQSKFILSPHGNGLDCHRTWEALYLGIFPIVKTSTLDKLYDDLPVIIVDDWQEITEEFLEKKYREMKNKEYKYEKLYFSYWSNLIDKYKNLCLKSKKEENNEKQNSIIQYNNYLHKSDIK